MSIFINGIIDCIALPSTSDTPVRVLRKRTNSGTSSSTEVTEPKSPLDASGHSSVSSVIPNAIDSDVGILPIKSVLTAEGIIDDNDDDVAPTPEVDDEIEEDSLAFGMSSSRSYRSIDDSTSKIFEEAFADFLWKNPAYSSMSYTTLTRLREKLLVQSARNVKVEEKLRLELEKMKENNRRTELMLQKELLGESKNTKSIREAELLKHIQESRDDRTDVGRYHSSLLTTGSRVPPSYVGYSPVDARYPSVMPIPHHWQLSHEGDKYQEGIRKSKMEQAHMIAELQKMKQEKMKKEIPSILSEKIKF